MISPIGPFLMTFDATLLGTITLGAAAIRAYVEKPLAFAIIFHYLGEGVRMANGDERPLQEFWPNFIRIIVVFWLITNTAPFTTYILTFFYSTIPDTMSAALAAGANINGTPPSVVISGVGGTAAAIDRIWDLMWVVVGTVWEHAGITDFAVILAAAATAATCGLAQLATVMVYIISRFLLAVVLEFAGLFVACGAVPWLRPILERAIGKTIALICLQVAAIAVLQLLLVGDLTFLGQIVNATASSTASAGLFQDLQNFFAIHPQPLSAADAAATATELQALLSMVVWFCGGAFAMYALPALAYSIGTGVAVSTLPAVLGVLAASRALGGGGGSPGLPALPSLPGGGSAYDVSFAPRGLLGGQGRLAPSSVPRLPPPAPAFP